ncbi:putative Ig domain-containing protein, partial [Pseudovibrio denitrificans]
SFGRDVIEDFAAGHGAGDVIQLKETFISSFPQLLNRSSQDGSDTTISLNDNSSIVLKKVQKSALHRDDFVFTNPHNNPPVINTPIPDTTLYSYGRWWYKVPGTTFLDPDGDPLSLTAELANGAALPSWMSFDGHRLSGKRPRGSHGDLLIKITASDGNASISDTFKVKLRSF